MIFVFAAARSVLPCAVVCASRSAFAAASLFSSAVTAAAHVFFDAAVSAVAATSFFSSATPSATKRIASRLLSSRRRRDGGARRPPPRTSPPRRGASHAPASSQSKTPSPSASRVSKERSTLKAAENAATLVKLALPAGGVSVTMTCSPIASTARRMLTAGTRHPSIGSSLKRSAALAMLSRVGAPAPPTTVTLRLRCAALPSVSAAPRATGSSERATTSSTAPDKVEIPIESGIRCGFCGGVAAVAMRRRRNISARSTRPGACCWLSFVSPQHQMHFSISFFLFLFHKKSWVWKLIS